MSSLSSSKLLIMLLTAQYQPLKDLPSCCYESIIRHPLEYISAVHCCVIQCVSPQCFRRYAMKDFGSAQIKLRIYFINSIQFANPVTTENKVSLDKMILTTV